MAMIMKIWPTATAFFQTLDMKNLDMVDAVLDGMSKNIGGGKIQGEYTTEHLNAVFKVEVGNDGLTLHFLSTPQQIGSYTISQLMSLKNQPMLHTMLKTKIRQQVFVALNGLWTSQSLMNDAATFLQGLDGAVADKGFMGKPVKATPFSEIAASLKAGAALGKIASTDKAEALADEIMAEGAALLSPVVPSTLKKQVLMNMTPVKLREALALYQAVQGTSPSSRYFLMASNGEVKVAARYNHTQLSIRVEADPKLLGGMHHALTEAGLELKGDYASEHFQVPSLSMARKTLGAVLAALGVEYVTAWPELGVIHNAGA